MRKHFFLILPLLLLSAVTFIFPTTTTAYMIDADSLTVGTYADISPLSISTAYGDVSFVGEIRSAAGDPEFETAGASGLAFDIADTGEAYLNFSFEITSASFIYGGNAGVFDIYALDIFGAQVDRFYQADTLASPAGPVTLSAAGIRTLYWVDPGLQYAALDNLDVTVAGAVPEPTTMLLFGTGLLGLAGIRRKIKK